MTKVIWKDIKGFEGYYKISNFGEVISLERKVDRRIRPMVIKEKHLKKTINNGGYYYIRPMKNGVKYVFRIHRLVAEAFVYNPLNKKCVNHKDGNKLNNHFSNLEYVTSSENNQHAYDIGLKKAFSIKVIDESNNKEYNSIKDAAKDKGITMAHLANMLRGRFKNTTTLKYKNK